jgi:phosphoserine phosphatase
MIRIEPEDAKKRLPAGLLNRLEQIDEWYTAPESNVDEKIAVFDLDNTLLIGDVGDALFARLKIEQQKGPLTVEGNPIPLTWPRYRKILETRGKLEAYPLITTVMAGIPVQTVRDATRSAMYSMQSSLEIEGEIIPVPVPHPVMQALVFYLHSLEYKVFVISASNQESVQWVAEEFFGIPRHRSFGMKQASSRREGRGDEMEDVLEDWIDGPITVEEGKVEAYRQMVGKTPPLITGGDSTTDIPMLNLVHPEGLVLWVNNDPSGVETVNRAVSPTPLIYIPAGKAV